MDNYPEIGLPNMQLIRNLRKSQELGDKLILWTCRAGDKLQEAVEWCREHGLLFDAVNDNLPEMVEKWGFVRHLTPFREAKNKIKNACDGVFFAADFCSFLVFTMKYGRYLRIALEA